MIVYTEVVCESDSSREILLSEDLASSRIKQF